MWLYSHFDRLVGHCHTANRQMPRERDKLIFFFLRKARQQEIFLRHENCEPTERRYEIFV